jgi:hypothetical protein
MMTHFHIRWSKPASKTASLDWERFDTQEEAEASAKQLVLPGETYSIEELDRACPRCAAAESERLSRGTSS